MVEQPLTIEELKTMPGEPIWVSELQSWALVELDEWGEYAGIPFAYGITKEGTPFSWNIVRRKLHCYKANPQTEKMNVEEFTDYIRENFNISVEALRLAENILNYAADTFSNPHKQRSFIRTMFDGTGISLTDEELNRVQF